MTTLSLAFFRQGYGAGVLPPTLSLSLSHSLTLTHSFVRAGGGELPASLPLFPSPTGKHRENQKLHGLEN